MNWEAIFNVTSALWGAVGLLIGTLVGHRFALFRDRRAEWNELVMPIRSILVEARADFSPVDDAITFTCRDALKSRMSNRRWKRLSAALHAIDANRAIYGDYDASRGDSGPRVSGDQDAMARAFDEALDLLRIR